MPCGPTFGTLVPTRVRVVVTLVAKGLLQPLTRSLRY